MAGETPTSDMYYNKLIRESHDLAYKIGGDPEILDGFALRIFQTILDAVEAKLRREDIETALKQGLYQGELQCADPSLTPEYWEAVHDD
jgi:hypothetical protein